MRVCLGGSFIKANHFEVLWVSSNSFIVNRICFRFAISARERISYCSVMGVIKGKSFSLSPSPPSPSPLPLPLPLPILLDSCTQKDDWIGESTIHYNYTLKMRSPL